ncbi:MAG: glycosyltransferase, partial [Actinomycetota bacterium]
PYPSVGERQGGNGGVSSYSANLARALRDQGLGVTVIAPFQRGCPPVEVDAGVEVRRTFDLGARALPRAARAAVGTGASVVHLQHEMFLYGGPSWIAGLPAGLGILRRAGAGPVVTMHQVVEPATVDASFTRLHRVRVPAPVARAGIFGVQETIRRIAPTTIVHETSFADTLPGTEVVPHGVELASPRDRAEARGRFGLDSRLTVLCFGYVAPYKGLEAALDAARLAGTEIDLVIAGGAHPRLAGRDDYQRELVRQFGEVARFTGYVPEEEVARWFAAADVALLPYPKPFSSSGALALALAYGTPVLVSDELARTTAAPSSLATSIEPTRLADRLVALREPARLEMLRRVSLSLARDRGWPEVARRHLSLYREVSHAASASGRRFRTA